MAEALVWAERAAKLGHPEGMRHYGACVLSRTTGVLRGGTTLHPPSAPCDPNTQNPNPTAHPRPLTNRQLWNGVVCLKQEKEGVAWLVKAAVAGDDQALAGLRQILPVIRGNSRADPRILRQVEDGLRLAEQAQRR